MSGIEEIEGFELSPQQKRLLLLQGLASDLTSSSRFVVQLAIAINGNLQSQLLKEAVIKLVKTHDILRTVFTHSFSLKTALQSVSTTSTDLFMWSQVNYSQFTSAAQTDFMNKLLEDKRNNIDLTKAPYLDITLVKLNEAGLQHILIFTLPALYGDLKSLEILFQQLITLYNEVECGQVSSSEVEESTFQYSQFATWQNQLLIEAETEQTEALRYWQKYLLPAYNQACLPLEKSFFDSNQAKVEVSPIKYVERIIPESLCSKLQDLADHHHTTLSQLLLACWEMLIAKLQSNADQPSVIGVNFENRAYDIFKTALGAYARYLPLTLKISSDMSLLDVISELKIQLEKHEEWQDTYQWLTTQPADSPLLNPLNLGTFPFGFDFSTYPGSSASGLAFSMYAHYACTEVFKLRLTCVKDASGIKLYFYYDTVLFDSRYIELITDYFTFLVENVTGSLEIKLPHLKVLHFQQVQSLFSDYDRSTLSYDPAKDFNTLFEYQVKSTPFRTAVACSNRTLTYSELNRQAELLAAQLHSLGVTINTPVGLLLERSVDLIVAIVAIYKAGGGYVPFDHEQPLARLRFQLMDSQVSIVLANTQFAPLLEDFSGQLVYLDDFSLVGSNIEIIVLNNRSEDSSVSAGNFTSPDISDVQEGEGNLAYIIYTSGSTGTPKGVVINQRSLINYTYSICAKLGLTPGNLNPAYNFATVSTIAADLGNTAIYPALLTGGCVHLVTYEVATDSYRFAHYLLNNQIDVLKIVPSHLSSLLSSSNGSISLPRKFLILGGEILSYKLVERIKTLNPVCRILNHYGPTEATVGSLVFELPDELNSYQSITSTVPVGRPLANTQIFILDRSRQIVPVGVTGEIYIGGAGLARHYLNQPLQTNEKFIELDLADNEGEPSKYRVYRTGDLGRYLPDSTVEFMGRADQQIKLRGHRIELTEIQAILNQHPAVKEAIVSVFKSDNSTMIDDANAHDNLIAYVIPQNASNPAIKEQLREFLTQQLPDYMVPAFLNLLPSFPLTPNGKIDYKALSAAAHSFTMFDNNVVAPSSDAPANPLEELLVNIWGQLLGSKKISRFDNFFSLGGHSLLGTQLISRLRQTLSVDISVRTLFEAPVLADLAGLLKQKLAHLSPSSVPQLQPIQRPIQIDNYFEMALSFGQTRLWFLQQFRPDSHSYNIPIALHLHGLLDVTSLRQSLEAIINRHEILRTTIGTTKTGEPVQRIHPASSYPILLTVDKLPLKGQEIAIESVELAQYLQVEASQPFDLVNGPLWRVSLIEISPTEHIFMLIVHHVISDGWSGSVFVQELSEFYSHFHANHPVTLQSLKLQYGDFALWQRECFQGELLTYELSYWRQRLKDFDNANLELPTDHPRSIVRSYLGGTYEFNLDPGLSNTLSEFSLLHNATLFMVTLATFQLLLYRYTGQSNIVVGTPIAGRYHQDLENLIGFFVNMLVLAVQIDEQLRFEEFLNQVRDTTLDAYAHGDIPFEKLVEELQPTRQLNQNPLFQVCFALHNNPVGQLKMEGLEVSSIEFEQTNSRFDLEFNLAQTDDGLKIIVVYSADLFEASTIARMVQHYITLLKEVVAKPTQLLKELEWLSATEKEQILVDWNDTAVPFEQTNSLPALFERQVAKEPEALAVLDGHGMALTYGELNAKANRLARFLKSLGVDSGKFVAIYMDYSIEMVVAVLAVLKAGGAYVPLETSYPESRVNYIVQSMDIMIMLTQNPLLMRLTNLQTANLDVRHLICLDAADESAKGFTDFDTLKLKVWYQKDWTGQIDTNLTCQISATDIAYVIFTSGTTGTPKGVVVQHRPVVNLIEWVNNTFNFRSSDRVLFVTSLCFDLSVYDIFGLLAAGGSIRFTSEVERHSPELLLQILLTEPITFWDSAPPALQQLVPLFDPLNTQSNNSNNLRLVFLSGDWISITLPDNIRQIFSAAQVISLGGATEATIWSNYYMVDKVDSHWPSIPYGRPIQNARYYILDHNLHSCSIGIAGDLYIGGDCLALGYAGDPVKTVEKFIPDPFSLRPGDRIYKTGDRARFMIDGNIQLLGRQDHQVKIRGFRVELGEIEVILREHPAIKECLVMLREDPRGDKRLVAYLIAGESNVPGTTELYQWLKHRLPDYMLVSTFVFLDQWPLTSNGKLDRAALPSPEQQRPVLASNYLAPQTQTQAVLARIWEEVLQIQQIGLNDNFFELGGHSLLAFQVINRINETFQLQVPLRSIFEAPTIAEFVMILTEQLDNTILEEIAGIYLDVLGLSDDQVHELLLIEEENDAGSELSPS